MTKARTLADNYAADISGITAGTGITGGGTSGTVTITNQMATTIDAKGDLVVGTGADTFGRLAVASTAGYLLTVDSAETTGLKWSAPSASGFVGCSIRKSTTTTSISNGTYTAFTADVEDWDTDGFHSTTTNTSRITIPSGKGGYYQISGKIAFAANASGIRVAGIYKNGTLVGGFTTPSISGSSINYPFLVTLNLVATDYIELYVYQDSGGALNLFSGYEPPEYTYLQAQFLGA